LTGIEKAIGESGGYNWYFA